MGRSLKFLAYFVATIVVLFVVTIVAVMVLFDVNDYREDIEAAVEANTGREFTIDGEMSLAVFPWLAIEIPHTELGNADGFSDRPFARFDEASLSVRLMPLLLDREVQVTVAELVGLQVNLEVNDAGRSNWQDFIDAAEAREAMPAAEDASRDSSGELDIAGINIVASSIAYADAQSGTDVLLRDLNVELGQISSSEDAIQFDGLSIAALIEGLTETPTVFALQTDALAVDTAAETVAMDDVDIDLLGLDIAALVEPFSYAAEITPVAKIEVAAFSLRNLMQRLDVEPPTTADPNALGKVTIEATAAVGAEAITLTDLTLVLDDTTFTGSLAIPQGSNDEYALQLKGDAMNMDNYMAPVVEGDAEASAAANEVPVEIPAELLRLVNAQGSLMLDSAHLSGMQFDDIELGVALRDGKLHMHPFSATLFDGQYNGDIRIDASGATPVLAVNERIEGVKLGALAKAMFDQDNITGTINGSFKLSGRGADMLAVQESLNGTIAMELIDGAFEGTDIWYELRKARAQIRQEELPEATLPARTPFSEVSVSGAVTNGVLTSDDLQATLPFMQLTGNGSVNFVAATVDYRVNAQVFEKPELVGDEATAEELEDLSKVRVPIRITGPVAAPSVKPDMEKLLRDAAKKEVEGKLKDALQDLLKR